VVGSKRLRHVASGTLPRVEPSSEMQDFGCLRLRGLNLAVAAA